MTGNRRLLAFAPLLLAALLLGCTQKNTGDDAAVATDVPTGLERFLLFPNPIAQSTGGFETNTTAYADAYYRAIDTDPANPKDTFEKWKTANGFGSGTGTEHLAVFRDTKDLGYGRRMTGRRNTHIDPKIDGSVAFFVENYSVSPNSSGDYSSILNVEAAIRRDTQWHVGTSAIEWSTATCSTAELAEGCDPTVKFAKFYNFSSADGTRQLFVDLDGKGKKAMPGPCITCHGGRGDPLTPDEGSPAKPRFPLIENSLSRKRGDTQARLQGLNVGSFGFSAQTGFTRVNQEDKLRDFNQWVLCTYPLAGAPSGAEDACRVPAGPNEWQGTAAEMVKSWYGMGMTGTFKDTYLPTGWSGNPSLYTDVVAPFCHTCHILRGTANQSDIDFTSLAKFQGYADRTKAHVFDRGTMPLALIVYNDFWKSSAPGTLATFIDSVLGAGTATTAGGAALMPGRPIADPGPDRMVRTGVSAMLSAEDSLFATTYNWSATGPGSVSFGTPSSLRTTFITTTAGEYIVTLTVNGGVSLGSTKTMKVTVSDTFPDPSTLRFARVENLLQTVSTCTNCHTPAGPAPIAYTNFDRNGSGGAADATDDSWFYKALMGRVNLTEIGASPILRKPSGKASAPAINNHHSGGALFNLDTPAGLSNFSIIYNWILAGAPAGGIAANAGADSTNSLTFPGFFPATNTVPLDGSASIGATSYAWSIFSATPTPHPNGTAAASTPASITQPNPALPGATLNLFDIGTYVVRLTASNGSDPDQSDDRTITVSETPLNFNVSVAGLSGGTVAVPFNGNPTGTITVNATQNAGNPLSCTWTVTPVSPDVTVGANSCSSATLTVSTNAVNSTLRTVTLTQQNLSLASVAVTSASFTVSAAAGSAPSGVSFTFPASSIKFTVGTNVASTPSPLINNVATSSITLIGSATGPGTLNYSWTATVGTAGCFIAAGSSTSPAKALTVTKAGTCNVTLTVSNGFSTTNTLPVTVSSGVVFSTVANLLTTAGCTGCHSGAGGTSPTPSWANDAGLFGRITGTAGVVDTAAPKSSLLLVCPQAGCSAVNTNTGTNQTMGGNQSTFVNGVNLTGYDTVLTWITNGATNP